MFSCINSKKDEIASALNIENNPQTADATESNETESSASKSEDSEDKIGEVVVQTTQTEHNDTSLDTLTQVNTQSEQKDVSTSVVNTTSKETNLPLFIYHDGEKVSLSGKLAKSDETSLLLSEILKKCTDKPCDNTLQYTDETKAFEIEEDMLKLINYAKEQKINDFALKLEEKTVSIKGTPQTQAQADALALYLEYIQNKGYTTEDETDKEKLKARVQEILKQEKVTQNIENANKEIGSILSKNSIRFDKASSHISQKSQKTLDTIVDILSDLDNIMIEVAGYTDAGGDKTYNKVLSQKRADAVRNYLIKSGTKEVLVTSTGYGEENFIATPNDSKNRRVEIHLKRRRIK
jgi:outer membrane protein OmpA-like peptidoglycan-associated protein